jgi:hypothetical protein
MFGKAVRAEEPTVVYKFSRLSNYVRFEVLIHDPETK